MDKEIEIISKLIEKRNEGIAKVNLHRLKIKRRY